MSQGESVTVAKQISPVLVLSLADKRSLSDAYIPFIKEGALFVGTGQQFQLGEQVSILLKLLDEPEKMVIPGKVVWITPCGAQHKRKPGVGVQFSGEKAKAVRGKIEAMLAGFNLPVEGADTF